MPPRPKLLAQVIARDGEICGHTGCTRFAETAVPVDPAVRPVDAARLGPGGLVARCDRHAAEMARQGSKQREQANAAALAEAQTELF